MGIDSGPDMEEIAGREPSFNPERKMAKAREDLPPLKEGFMRVVHLTSASAAEEITASGLDYSKYGMLSSTARAWSNADDVEFSSTDPRFQGEHMVAVVFDIPMAEHRLHENITKSPGKVSPEHIVGVVSDSGKN